MSKIPKEKMQTIIHIGIIIVFSFVVGVSLQLVHAWTEPMLTAPNGNLGAPINTGATTQIKTGGLYINGGTVTPLIWDTNDTSYYLDPNGSSRLNTLTNIGNLSANGTNAQFWYQGGEGEVLRLTGANGTNIHLESINGTFRLVNSPWSASLFSVDQNGNTSAWNLAVSGSLSTNNLCISGDCRNSWPTVANSINWNTWQYGNYYQTDGNIYMGWAGNWLSNVLGSKLQFNTWQYGNYYQTNGDIYMGWAGNWLSSVLGSKLQLNTWQGNHYSGSDGAEYATIFYDTNNASYYLDPSGTSNLNTINASTGSFAYITSVFGIRTPTILTAATFSDINNSSYYVTPSGTSNMNTIYTNNIHFVNAYADSDRRLKENITPLSNSLDKLNQINGVYFYWKDKTTSENKNVGVIAQDVEKVYPELVSTNPKTGMKSVEYSNLVAPIIEAIKELSHKVDDLFSKYLDQQKEIDELRLEINALKNSK